ncbi:hypothetical protein O6H91_23G032300 [Diphasiastrum complanatum]|uniref:Uncharacterized protein n=1 Tax=Diphasiastrum complanatum TaxID=34168 RepID=A0ACC2A9J4_DIPCM|nr:hypothetical protein O6H91_23G032300 [Diphasiastrum complanatum]
MLGTPIQPVEPPPIPVIKSFNDVLWSQCDGVSKPLISKQKVLTSCWGQTERIYSTLLPIRLQPFWLYLRRTHMPQPTIAAIVRLVICYPAAAPVLVVAAGVRIRR